MLNNLVIVMYNIAIVFVLINRYKGPKDIYIERVLVTSNAEEVSDLFSFLNELLLISPGVNFIKRLHL